MKRFIYPALFLGLLTFTFAACGNDDEDDIAPKTEEPTDPDNGDGKEDPTDKPTEPQGIVVHVDANGNASDGHTFTLIDDNNFYIDDIKYTADEGELSVTGYNTPFSKAQVNIISELDYQGQKLPVTSIGVNALQNCEAPTTITIPSSVTRISNGAFQSCSKLVSIAIPNSVTSIGNYALFNCGSLSSITLPDCLTSIGVGTFKDCRSLASIAIPRSVTSIGGGAFGGCNGFTSITIPRSVTSIGEYAFEGCNELESIKVEPENTVYDSRDNCNAIINSKTNHLFKGCKNTIIPNSVTSISGGAFDGCTGLVSITIPDSVTVVGVRAFAGCRGLTTITISNGVTIIGDLVFLRCTGLTTITIGRSVTKIGDRAFAECTGLQDVYCYAERIPDSQGDFFSHTPVAEATLHVPARAINVYKDTYPWRYFGKIVAIEE